MANAKLRHTGLCIVMIICFPPAALAFSGDNGAVTPYHIGFGYWNDNLLFADGGNDESLQGKDDYVTAGFWLRGALDRNDTRCLLDFYYTILTDKVRNYRTDLVTFRLSAKRELSFGTVQAGTGMIASGDFGGSAIQNGYHRLMGYDRVSLPYDTNKKAGPVLYLRFARRLVEWRSGGLFAVYVSDAHRFRVAPSALRVGDELSLTRKKSGDSPVFHVQVHTGYIRYHDRGEYFSSLFDRGFYWGVLGSVGTSGGHHVALWVTRNQYGKHQPHFGISYMFGGAGTKVLNISDILYP